MLSFLYPAFLIGAAAVAIPVLLHLLRNEQAPETPFSAVRLLQDLKVEHTERRRIRDWLLLALRMAALLLLAVAFARPYLPGGLAAGGNASVIVLDRSASMGLGRTWQSAKEAVIAELDRARSSEAFALVAFDDRPEVVVEPTFDRGAVKAALGRIEPGIGGTRYQPALARTVSLLDEFDARAGRIVLVSDLQGTVADARVTMPEAFRLDVRSVAAPVENVAILAARRNGDGVIVTLRHDGRETSHVRVRLDVDGRVVAEVPCDLPPSQLVDVQLRAAVARGHARVSLAEPDRGGFTADDARYLDLEAGPRTRILVVSAPEDRFYIDAALQAAEDGVFEVSTATAQGLLPALARQPRPEIVFLVGPRGLDKGSRDALARYVRDGGRVFVGASDTVNEPPFGVLLEGMTVSVPRADDPVLTLAAVEARHPLFRRLGSLSDALGAARFTRAWRVRAPGWEVLASFNDGAPALVERTIGAGRVLFFASDVNRGWNDLPLQSAFVPFVHEVARYLAPERGRNTYTPAMLPDGVRPALGFVSLPAGQTVAVNADPRESDVTRMDVAQFSSAVRHRGERRLDPATAQRRAQSAEEHQSLWRYGLMLMLATLVAEGLLSGSPRRTLSGGRV